jgi:hypothetical protein
MAAEETRFVDRVFLTRRRRPRLARCAVLFVDLLGVSAMNRSRSVARHLVALERAVTGTYRDFLSQDSPWPAAFFSDTLVLAAPVEEHGGEEAAIGGLVLQAAWLQLELVNAGFFVRGGLSLGRMHLRDGLVFGPALVEAYELESRTAVHPRVILSVGVDASQRADLHFHANPSLSPQAALLLCDGDGHTFINYLGLLLESLDDPVPGLVEHRDVVISRLEQQRGDKRRWEKYRWVAEYHNAIIDRAMPEHPDLRIDTQVMTWKFNAFA